jgi:hypothetical protein
MPSVDQPTQQSSDPTRTRELMLRLWLGKEFAAADSAILEVADFSVSLEEDRPFVEFIKWLNSRPEFIVDWRADPQKEKACFLRFMSGLEACRVGYAACAFHLHRLSEIEGAIHAVLERFDFTKTIPRNGVATLGGMRRFDFEYQAFVMAYRRSLDGFAWGLSTYFKQSQSSFRRFAEHLPKYHPTPVANAIDAVCTTHIGQLKFVMDKERGKSVRDRMAHKEAVQAGVINIGSFGHRIVGGGEDLGFENIHDAPRLHGILQDRLKVLNMLVSEVLEAFQVSVMEYERKSIA